MIRVKKPKLIFTVLLISFFALSTSAQDEISWLSDFTEEMQIGNDTYRYQFSNVDGNDCKFKIEELVTDKKGSTDSRYWIFYLSDIDPAAISYKSKGKAIEIVMETRQSQKFISYFEEGEFDEYTEEIEMSMNEVDLTRSFIDVLKENIPACKESQTAWDNRDDALAWLAENIGEAVDDDTRWDQEFKPGDKSYLVQISSKSTDDDGDQESFEYLLDLNDLNPMAVNLKVSGKSLSVELPVRESENYIEVEGSEGKEYTDELLIYADDIEMARQIVNALSYAITNTQPERPKWDNYSAALNFVKTNLGEVKMEEDIYVNSIEFDNSPSGLVEMTVEINESGEERETVKYAFYMADIMDKLALDVSKSSIEVKLETRNKRDFIRVTSGDNETDYSNSLDFYLGNIDLARDIINAFETAARNSQENIVEFSGSKQVQDWFNENIATLEINKEIIEQEIILDPSVENQLQFTKKITDDEGEITEKVFIIYPEDISAEEMEISVAGSNLVVPLETGKGKYVKTFENGTIDNFDSEAEVIFFDPLVAKNFMAAIRYLKENSVADDRENMSRADALSFLQNNIRNIELNDEKHEQKIEMLDDGNCKMKFTRIETDDDGGSDEYIYEFIASDIHKGNSELDVSGELIEIHLVTRGKEKLIKPYENGEVEDFEDEFTIYTDDILLAKKTLAAFVALSNECQ